ncbi:MAG TPA: hypothetical protein VKU92_06735 [Acidimicrobiales bacterium]|nr:hypothetical protein [Acidimicrobiales bacterium]
MSPAVPPVAVAASELARGWRPTSDDAALAWRTFDVLSGHAPLLGAFNEATVAGSRPVFDLGPLEYYLLAVPVRLDPVHGLLWGAALCVALLVGLSVEAAWRAGGPGAGWLVSAGWLAVAATQTRALLNLPWNPNLGLYAFGATLVLSIAVAAGRTGWWPLAVVTGSLAAQCHLVYAASSLAAVAGGLALALLPRRSAARPAAVMGPPHDPPAPPRRHLGRHVALGLVAGGLTLLAPAVQELTAHPGNLTLLLRDLSRHGRRLGAGVGWAGLAKASLLPPAWARPAPPIHGQDWYLRFLKALFSGSAGPGIAITLAAFVLGVAALAAGHRLAGGTGIIAALAGGALVATIAGIASSQAAVLTYVDVALWPAGMALDAGVVSCAAVLVMEATARSRRRHPAARARGRHRRVAWSRVGALPALGGTAALGALLAWPLATGLPATASGTAVIGGWAAARAAGPLAAELRRATSPGRCHSAARGAEPAGAGIDVEPGDGLLPGGLDTWSLVEAVAYQLKVDGCGGARLLPPMATELGADAEGSRSAPAWMILPERTRGGKEAWRAVFVARSRPYTLFGVGR